jgi:hypothetical protein|tara:strand:+ start:1576 stop:1722 length:147 start_codon:yes stop_codon:yes gene_type:complete
VVCWRDEIFVDRLTAETDDHLADFFGNGFELRCVGATRDQRAAEIIGT